MNKKVVLNFPENAIINDTNSTKTLIELQPSITLATYFLLIISFIDGSFG